MRMVVQPKLIFVQNQFEQTEGKLPEYITVSTKFVDVLFTVKCSFRSTSPRSCQPLHRQEAGLDCTVENMNG